MAKKLKGLSEAHLQTIIFVFFKNTSTGEIIINKQKLPHFTNFIHKLNLSDLKDCLNLYYINRNFFRDYAKLDPIGTQLKKSGVKMTKKDIADFNAIQAIVPEFLQVIAQRIEQLRQLKKIRVKEEGKPEKKDYSYADREIGETYRSHIIKYNRHILLSTLTKISRPDLDEEYEDSEHVDAEFVDSEHVKKE